MGYKVFDYLCRVCEVVESLFIKSEEIEKPQRCPDCGSELVRLPPGTRTTFKHADRTAFKD